MSGSDKINLFITEHTTVSTYTDIDIIIIVTTGRGKVQITEICIRNIQIYKPSAGIMNRGPVTSVCKCKIATGLSPVSKVTLQCICVIRTTPPCSMTLICDCKLSSRVVGYSLSSPISSHIKELSCSYVPQIHFGILPLCSNKIAGLVPCPVLRHAILRSRQHSGKRQN